ncbi:CcdB family protein [Maricaulis parjimensis]|uniref:CcdB family protein n=1 Tax=Maricaulis parjimensis TaxID=144023 RepID=UPI00193A1250|nr:CcdB family protein [Maricaulis parjimensis]
MARFDLYRVHNWPIPLLVDVQADFLDDLSSRVVIPLKSQANTSGPDLPRLTPTLIIEGQPYWLMTSEIGAQPLRWLGQPVGNIRQHRDTITAAMDFLFQGF